MTAVQGVGTGTNGTAWDDLELSDTDNDGNGFLDVVSEFSAGNGVYWFENQSQQFAVWTPLGQGWVGAAGGP